MATATARKGSKKSNGKRGANLENERVVTSAGDLVLKLSQIDASWDGNISRQYPNEDALKASFENKAFKELMHGIKTDGLMHAVSVTLPEKEGGLYKLRAGFRRFEASKRIAGEKWKEATIKATVVSGSELKLDLMNIKENVQRTDVSPYQIAKAAFDLKSKHKLTQEQIGAELGKGDAYIGNLIRAVEKLSPSILGQWATAWERNAEGDLIHKQSLTRALSTDRINEYVMLPGGHEAQEKAFAVEQLKLEGMSEEAALEKVGAKASDIKRKGKKKKAKVASVSGKVLSDLRDELEEVEFDSDDDERYQYRDGALACLDFLMQKEGHKKTLHVGQIVFFDPSKVKPKAEAK